MAKKNNITILIASLLFGGFTYLLTFDIIISLVVWLCAAFASHEISRSLELVATHQQNILVAHQIIHSVTIDLTTQKSLHLALENMNNYLHSKYLQIMNDNPDNNFRGLQEIAQSLEIIQFQVFVKTLELYENQGGDLYKMNYQLLTNIDNLKIKTDKLIRIKKTKVKEIALMWGLVAGILIYMRFGLYDFYLSGLENPLFKYAIAVGLLLAIGMFIIVFKNYQRINLERGENK